jgi:RNA polymerase sigma factor (sigma-70 family)
MTSASQIRIDTRDPSTSVETDAELVAHVLAGDATAFETLVRRHFRACFAVAMARLRDADEAEDVCQDALVRAYEWLADCRDPSRFGRWLLRIVRNRALRRVAYETVRRAVGLDRAEAQAGGSTPEEAAVHAELRHALAGALAQLRPVAREVVLLYDHEGFAHREIAERLGISEAMSRRHLSDARARLRRILERHGSDRPR